MYPVGQPPFVVRDGSKVHLGRQIPGSSGLVCPAISSTSSPGAPTPSAPPKAVVQRAQSPQEEGLIDGSHGCEQRPPGANTSGRSNQPSGTHSPGWSGSGLPEGVGENPRTSAKQARPLAHRPVGQAPPDKPARIAHSSPGDASTKSMGESDVASVGAGVTASHPASSVADGPHEPPRATNKAPRS